MNRTIAYRTVLVSLLASFIVVGCTVSPNPPEVVNNPPNSTTVVHDNTPTPAPNVNITTPAPTSTHTETNTTTTAPAPGTAGSTSTSTTTGG